MNKYYIKFTKLLWPEHNIPFDSWVRNMPCWASYYIDWVKSTKTWGSKMRISQTGWYSKCKGIPYLFYVCIIYPNEMLKRDNLVTLYLNGVTYITLITSKKTSDLLIIINDIVFDIGINNVISIRWHVLWYNYAFMALFLSNVYLWWIINLIEHGN